jgi:hypothetical protein
MQQWVINSEFERTARVNEMKILSVWRERCSVCVIYDTRLDTHSQQVKGFAPSSYSEGENTARLGCEEVHN